MDSGRSAIVFATKRVPSIPPKRRLAFAPDPYVSLPVAAHLERAGYRVTFIDCATEDDPVGRIRRAGGAPSCVGIDAQSSYSVVEAFRIAGYIKRNFPATPVIWFGYASSAIHNLLAQSPLADVVVRGIPENTFVRAVKGLQEGLPLQEVHGITYLHEGQVRVNPNARLELSDDAPPTPYHLLDIDKYMVTRGYSIYRGSVGCASQCSFCWFPLMYGRTYAAFSPGRVLADLRQLDRQFGLKHVRFADQSFFASRRRVADICEGLVREGPTIRWRASGQVELLNAFDDALWRLMKDSGCHLLTVGVETGSVSLLHLLHKTFTPAEVMALARRLRTFDIKLEVNLVFGLPGETEADLGCTLDLLSSLREIDGRTTMSYHFYTPMADSLLYREKQDQIHMPGSVEEYVRVSRRMGIPWAVGGYRNGRRLFYYIAAYTANRYARSRGPLKVLYMAHRKLAIARLRRGYFGLPADWVAARALYALRQKRLWQAKYQIQL